MQVLRGFDVEGMVEDVFSCRHCAERRVRVLRSSYRAVPPTLVGRKDRAGTTQHF